MMIVISEQEFWFWVIVASAAYGWVTAVKPNNSEWLDRVVDDLHRKRQREENERLRRDILHAREHGYQIWISDLPGWEEEILGGWDGHQKNKEGC